MDFPSKTMESYDAIKLGQKLIAIRKYAGMSQSELAIAVMCTQPAIHYYEKGIHRPPIETINAIRVATGTEGIPLTDYEIEEFKKRHYEWNRTTSYDDIAIEQVKEKIRELDRCKTCCFDADLEIFCTLFSAIYNFNINGDGESRRLLDSLEKRKKEFTNEHKYWYHWCQGSILFWCEGRCNTSVSHFLNAEKYGGRLSSDLRLDFKVLYYCTGLCYSRMDYHYMAREYLDRVKGKLFESFNVTMSLTVQRCLAMGYIMFMRIDVALDLLESCRAYAVKERKEDRLTLGGIYLDMGRAYQYAKDYENAFEYYNTASQYFDKNSDAYLQYLCYKASLLRTYNKFDMVDKCLNEGLPMATKGTVWYEWLNAIKHSLTLEDESSIKYMKWTAIPRLREYGRNLLVRDCCIWLSDHYHSTQCYKPAYEYNNEASEIYIKLMEGDLTLCKNAHYQY